VPSALTGSVYLVDFGFKRLIPDPATYKALFRDWTGIVDQLNLDELPDGPMLSIGAALVRGKNAPTTIFLIDRGMKRAIADEAAFERYAFNAKKIMEVPDILLEMVPSGKPLA
jgi:hypothetical protein